MLLSLLLMSGAAIAQPVTVQGTVIDTYGEPIIGATVAVKGTTSAVITDIDGKFSLQAPSADAIVVVTYVGYKPDERPAQAAQGATIVLEEDRMLLEEVVVIGYGQVRKKDLTGSITTVGERDFRQGVVRAPGELLTGKVAGVQIISNGGRAGDGTRIRIRGGASLNASNDPLIVVDGMPLDNGGISGAANALATINPNDVESMTVLKDASATAIYGSRASNGVILITTKKGEAGGEASATGGGLGLSVSSQNSIATIARKVDLLSADEFRSAVTNYYRTEQRFIDLLGAASTNWQDEIFRTAFTSDNNVSFSGAMKNLPYRVSAGFLSQDGTLKTDNMQRTTVGINLAPSLLDNHLNITLNLKGSYAHSRFGNGDAIGAAIRMDPTKPVTADGFDQFNGYWTWMEGNTAMPNTLATKNPVALLYGVDDQADVLRSIGNVQLDYKMHFLPELRANLNVGYDMSQGKGDKITQLWSPDKYAQGGEKTQFKQQKQNLLFEFYLNYTKDFNSNNRLEIMAGHTYQDWKTTDHNYVTTDFYGSPLTDPPSFPTYVNQNTLVSFYGRLNYTLFNRYLLTATIRTDGSSRFSKENRWGVFPSAALAWRISDEGFLKDVEALSNLKLRVGYGVTGQQEGIGNYDHIARYDYSDPTAQVQFGDQWYYLWRPAGYDATRRWEQTATTNIGVDFGFFKNRFSGSVEYYNKHTTDLLNTVPLPMGSNFTNQITRNIGSLDNQGVEANFNVAAIDSRDIALNLGFNITYNKTEITKLSLNDSPASDYVGAQIGGISGGTGNTIQIHSVGYAPYTFYVYKQIYDQAGKPVEGVYADLNGDGIVNEKDLYHYKSAEPDVYMGFSADFRYKQFTVATALRASIGNYMYNNVYSDIGNFSQTLNPNNFLMNTVHDATYTNFFDRQLLSDYYVQNASFLKMDYLTLGYNFGKIAGIANLNVGFTVQNVFTITKYDGIDPEIAGGIDNNFYPNPRTFMLGINLNF
jgi:iron complex outermembrane receptor protein